MINDSDKTLPSGCRLIAFPEARDERGALVFAEAEMSVPFTVRRTFWIYDVPEGAARGGHAHWSCSEVVVPVCGGFTMVVSDGNVCRKVELNSPKQGILIPAGIWCELRDFQPNTVLMVMASEPYRAEGYVHSYSEYLKMKTS